MKLSKMMIKNHNIAMDLVHSDKVLNEDEKIFILENFQESADHVNSAHGAFFTPLDLAFDFTIEVPDSMEGLDIIDLCAGIGMLSFASRRKAKQLTCIEFNPNYIQVGKRVLPEAEWIHADALSFNYERKYDFAISNPPFGNIKTGEHTGKYKGSKFEWKIAEKASEIAVNSALIIPRNSACISSGGADLKKFMETTGIVFEDSCVLIDDYRNEWKGVNPDCVITTI